jgi:hypothetical protein
MRSTFLAQFPHFKNKVKLMTKDVAGLFQIFSHIDP